MYLFWIGFYYLVLFQVWVYRAIGFIFVLFVYCVIVFEVEVRCLAPPIVLLIALVLFLLGNWSNSSHS